MNVKKLMNYFLLPQIFVLVVFVFSFLKPRNFAPIMVKRYASIVQLSISLLLAVSPFALRAQNGIIAGVPSSLTVQEGDSFVINWYIAPGKTPVSAVDFVLRFNPEEIEVMEILTTESPLSIQPIKPSIDHERGRIVYSAFKLQSPWPSQPFIFVGVKFKAIQSTPVTALYHNFDELPNTSMAFEGNMTMKEARQVIVHILDADIKPGKAPGNGEFMVNADDNENVMLQFTAASSGQASVILVSSNKDFGSIPIFNGQVKEGVEYSFSFPVKMLPSTSYQVELHLGSQIQSVPISQ